MNATRFDPIAEIPDEDAEVMPDGALRIFVDLRDGQRIAQADIPAPDWAWSKTGVQ